MGTSDPSNQTNEPRTKISEDVTLPKSPGVEVPHDVSFQGPVPSNHEELFDTRHREENSPEDYQEIEVLRDAVPDISPGNLPPVSPTCRNDISEPQEPIDIPMNEKGTLSPVMEENLTHERLSPHQPSSVPPPTSAASLQDGLEFNNSPLSFGECIFGIILHVDRSAKTELCFSEFLFFHISAIRSTPPVKQPKARPRKRKQCFDESPVLTNKYAQPFDPRALSYSFGIGH